MKPSRPRNTHPVPDRALSIFAHVFVLVFGLICLYPLLVTVSVSFSDEYLVQVNGFRLIPEQFSLGTYRYIFDRSLPRIARSYLVTITVTVVGTITSMLVTSMFSYAVAQKHVRYRNFLSFFSYFTVIFPAGMIPWYLICVNLLHINNTLFGLFVPYALNVWNMFLLRNYFQSIPASVTESAKIDGAHDFTIFARLVIPMSQTAVVTISMFYVIQYWNDWWLSIMLISKQALYPMQYFLFSLLSSVNVLSSGMVEDASVVAIPAETVKMAVTVITILPVLFLFPIIQRYFIKGIMVGAVKG